MTPASRNLILRILAILIIVAVAGPEMGFGLEAFAVLDILGAELFFLSFFVGIRLLPIATVTRPFRNWIERHDSYFFIPKISQIKECPGIVFHAVPGLVPLYFVVLFCGIA